MIKKTVLILAILVNIVISSKGNFIADEPSCTLKLKIKNSEGGTIFILKKEHLTGEDQTLVLSNIDKKSKFSLIKFECNSSQIVYFKFKDTSIPLFVEARGIIHISFDATDIDHTIKYKGSNSNINSYLIAKHLKSETFFPLDLKALYSLLPEEFNRLNDLAFSELGEVYKSFVSKNKANDFFRQYDEADIFSQWAIKKMNYPDYHFHFTKEKIDTVDYYSFFNKIPLANSHGLLSDNYVRLLSMYCNFNLRKTLRKTRISIEEEQLSYFNKKDSLVKVLFKNQDIREYFTTEVLLEYLDSGFDDIFQEKLKDAKKEISNTKYLQVAINKFTSLQEIGKGKVAPNFNFTDGNKELSLKSLQGNIVFINIWSLNCHSSMKELPYLQEIQKKFDKNDKIVFLNINNDNDENSLKEYLNTDSKEINGIIGNGKPQLDKSYFITNTPRYILINEQGKIIDSFAPRPSSPQLFPLLKSLLVSN